MTYGEFFVYYILLPWALAIVGVISTIIIIVLGGPELRTILSARLDGACQLVLGWVDGGQFRLLKYYPWEHGIMKNGNNFLQYTTPLTDVDFTPKHVTLTEARKQIPATLMDDATLTAQVTAQNDIWIKEAARKKETMKIINEDVKARGSWLNHPLWLGHLSIGVATTPDLMKRMSDLRKYPNKDIQIDSIEPVTIDVKDYLAVRFSPVTMFSILRAGEDYGRYGRPKGKFPMIIVLVLFLAVLFLVFGFLILSGRLDVSGWVKSLGLGG